MSLIETKTGRKYFKKAESLMLIPYVYESLYGVNDYVLGQNVYDISAVIGDSIALEQKDGEVEEKFNEFVSSPLIRNVTSGTYDFTAQCLDLQDNVLKAIFGAYYGVGQRGTISGVVAMPENEVLRYALIRIRFQNTSMPDVIFPKVQLNSKLLMQQMKSRGSQGNISGVALPSMVTVDDPTASSRKVLNFNTSDGQRGPYAPSTSVLFVDRAQNPSFFHHKEADNAYIFSTVNFNNGTVLHNRSVNISNGSYIILS